MWSIQIAQSRIKLQRSILAKLTGTCACIMPAAARAVRVVSAVASTAPEKLLGKYVYGFGLVFGDYGLGCVETV